MAKLKLYNSVLSLLLIPLLLVNYSSAKLVQLNEDNWDLMLEGEWMVEL